MSKKLEGSRPAEAATEPNVICDWMLLATPLRVTNPSLEKAGGNIGGAVGGGKPVRFHDHVYHALQQLRARLDQARPGQ
jgi:hypothetical protein